MAAGTGQLLADAGPDLGVPAALDLDDDGERLGGGVAGVGGLDDVGPPAVEAAGQDLDLGVDHGLVPGQVLSQEGAGRRARLVFRQLSATKAVTTVDAQTITHAYSDANDWRLDVLSRAERAALTGPQSPAAEIAELDDVDSRIAAALAGNGRSTVSSVARLIAQPESSVRRRMAGLFARGQLTARVTVDPAQLGFLVDASVLMQVPPGALDRLGRLLAG